MDATPPVEPAVERLITVRHAARLLGVGRHVLYRAVEAGELAIFHAGGWSRTRASDLESWLQKTRRRPGGGAR